MHEQIHSNSISGQTVLSSALEVVSDRKINLYYFKGVKGVYLYCSGLSGGSRHTQMPGFESWVDTKDFHLLALASLQCFMRHVKLFVLSLSGRESSVLTCH